MYSCLLTLPHTSFQCALLLQCPHCVPPLSAMLAERHTAVPLWNIHRLSRTSQLHHLLILPDDSLNLEEGGGLVASGNVATTIKAMGLT